VAFLKNLKINKIAKNRVVLILMLFLFNLTAVQINGQFYSMGSEPSWVTWKIIQTENFKIIYPNGIDSLAQRYAFLMESANTWVQRPLKIKANPIEVVLHPYNVMSNGLVVWAPKRIELMTTPLALGGYAQNWEKQLVVHEIRHLAQISKFEHGIFKPLSWFIGQQAQGLGVGLYIDKWALEGDAVVSETELSATGRGRDPEHLIYFKASFLDGEYRSWIQWKLGSGKKFCPDIYSLGYLVHSFIRYSSGNYYYMGDLAEYLIRNFYNPSTSKKAYLNATGNRISGHFENIKELLGANWATEDSLKKPFTPYKILNKRGKDYSSYKSIVVTSGDSIYAVKWDMDEPSRLVLLDSSGSEKIIRHLGIMSSNLIHGNGKLYWTEQVYSNRWEQQTFSILKSYDIKKKKVANLTKRSSYSNPSISGGGDTIAVAEYYVAGSSGLVLLAGSGYKPIATFIAPENGQIKESVFFENIIYATVITNKGMGLFSFDLKRGTWNREIEEQNRNITRLNSYKDALYFESDLNGTNNIYCYRPQIKFLQRLTNARFGAFAPYIDGLRGKLYYSDYDINGYKAVVISLDSLVWEPATFLTPYKNTIANILSQQAGYSIDTVKVSFDKQYESKKYKKGANLIRIHSWAPFYYNVNKIKNISYDNFYEILSPGVTVYSQNTLSTATAMLAYSYGNGFHAAHMNFSYSGIYPVVEIKMDYNERIRNNILLTTDDKNRKVQLVTPVQNSPYATSSALVYLPVNLSRGGWRRGLIPKILWRFSNDSYYSYISKKYRPYQYFSYGIQYYSILNSSTRGLYPKWGIGVNAQMNFVPYSEENFGALVYTNIYGYIPGFIANHGVRLSVSYQRQNYNGKNYLFSNLASSPRGYEQLYGKQFSSFSLDYAFPIYLGDIELSTLLYLKKLQVIPFVDWGYNQGLQEDKNMLSAGGDVLVDFNVFNIPLPLSAGFRYARTMDRKNLFQILFILPM